jgi:hypothetical protein
VRTIFEEIKSTLVKIGDRRAYKIALKKWKKKNEGIYLSIERHDGKPNSLNKEEISWFLAQSLTISDANVVERLIDEMRTYLELLKVEQENIKEEVKKKFEEEVKKKVEEEVKKKFEEDEEGILKVPHLETMEEKKKRNEETSIFDDEDSS